MKRARLVSIATIAFLLLGAAPAWAIYTRVVGIDINHVRAGGNAPGDHTTAVSRRRPKTKISGKVVLDNRSNPPNLPPEKVQCFKNRLVKIYKVVPGDDKVVGSDRTNAEGKFSDTFKHTHGAFIMYLPEKDTTNPKYSCYQEHSPRNTHEGHDVRDG